MTSPDEPIFVGSGADQPPPPSGGAGLVNESSTREPAVAEAHPGPSPANRPSIVPSGPRKLPNSPHQHSDLAPRPPHGGEPARSGVPTVLASGVLALLMGGLGAWGFLHYIEPSLRKASPQSAAEHNDGSAATASANLDDRVKEIATRVDELSDRLAKLPKQTAPDLEPINQRLSTFEDVPRKLAALEERVRDLPPRIDEEGKKIAVVSADLEGLRTQVTGLRSELLTESKPPGIPARRDADLGRTAGPPPDPLSTSAEPASKAPSLDSGAALFRSKKYEEASRLFEDLTKSDPGDARIWYYAALARGLATRDWKGETEALVERGVDREKAGSPAKGEIDDAFTGLTPETGRDWLAFFRNRAREASAGR